MKTIKAFWLGMMEYRASFTTHISDRNLQDAYDWGREWAHRLTLRKYEA